MKCCKIVGLAGVMVGLVACASTPVHYQLSQAVGPAPKANADIEVQSGLQVYSARQRKDVDVNQEEWLMNNDFGKNEFLYEAAPSDYSIYTESGTLLMRVHNARRVDDERAAVVALPPGRYEVLAHARQVGEVTVPVVIEPGKLTVVNLQRNRHLANGSLDKKDFVWLQGYRMVGWRANATASASSH
jgi:hypothetical protein